MKLNPDCIRDILLTAEDTTGTVKRMKYPGDYPLLNKFSQEEVLYHINQCQLTGYFTSVAKFSGGGCTITDLSPLGHEFLANTRKEENWNKTKTIAKQVGSFSLSTLSDIASNIVSNAVNTYFTN